MNVGYKTESDLLKEEKFAVLEDKSNNSNKYVVWHIEGGLGKNVAATALISSIKQKYKDRKLILVVSYPEVFLNHPDIHRVYRVGMTSYFYDDYINGKDTIIFRHEPYFQSDHIMRKKHLIENWCDLLGIKYTEQTPQLYPNAVQKMILNGWQRERPVMVIHTNGGPYTNELSYAWTRDMPYEVALKIADKYRSQYHIIQVARPSAPLIPNVEHVTQQLSNFELFSVLAVSEKRVLIDSSLQHAAAAMGLSSTVLWIGTFPVNFGYKFHKNVVAKQPTGSNKMIDSYIFDFSFDGIVHECPYNSFEEMFDINTIFKNI